MAKAAAGSPVAVGFPHPKGSSPFPLRHFFFERLLYLTRERHWHGPRLRKVLAPDSGGR
jgi:hypothetical protein